MLDNIKKFITSPKFLSFIKYMGVAAAGYYGGPAAGELVKVLFGS
jgi:hypothetical protein